MEGKTSLDQPLIVAAYLYGDPSRKRRVKVPPSIKWAEFLALFYSRLELSPNVEIEIFDEKGIGIVSVDDLVEGDVLVVKEKWPKLMHTHQSKSRKTDRSVFAGSSVASMPTHVSHDLRVMSRDPSEPPSAVTGIPGLSHFIQCNSFGYYFLAEVENSKLLPEQGKMKKTHCVIKVPLRHKETGTLQTFEIEATLLRRISSHKCIVSAPTVQILNFSDRHLQTFYKSLPLGKQELVQELFLKAGYLEAYMYPLYGVTMATKIRTGLSPDKVLRYAYQLAEVMHYLQQRGVIHLNLLPENIQVMSNDRLILCNFETAVQTDPTTCLLITSKNIVAPSNKKGLAPEVISTLSRLRLETETVDYSTQYPWSFGVLSVVMATGQHPLKDYPNAFESAFRVKYRSHHFQALLDPEQYPPIFCKLVKKSLSCDPMRRPTLPQIFSIIRKDSRIMSVMSKGRFTHSPPATGKIGGSEVGIATTQIRGVFDPIRGNEQAETVANKPHPSTSRREFHETHPPSSYGFARSTPTEDPPPRDHVTRHNSHEHLQKMNSRVFSGQSESRDQSHNLFLFSAMDSSGTRPHSEASNRITDPFYLLEGARSHGYTSTAKKKWDVFGEGRSTPITRPESTPISARVPLALRSERSGAFSDDFVSPQLSRESSGRSPQKGVLSAVDLLQERVKGTPNSESDLSPTQDVPYQRLVPSPQAGNSSDDHTSPTLRVSDQERLVRGSSPEQEETRSSKLKENAAKNFKMATKKHSPELIRPRVSRSSSSRVPAGVGEQPAAESPLIVRRCFSDEPTKMEKMDTSVAGPARGVTALGTGALLSTQQSHDHHMTSQEFEPQSHDVHMNTQSEGSPSSGPEGILMSDSLMGQTTDTQTTHTSFNLTGQSQATRESPENMDVQSAAALSDNLSNERGLLSPEFSNSKAESLASNKEFWVNVMGSREGGGGGVDNNADRPGNYLFSLDDISFPAVNGSGNPPVSMGNSLSGDPLVILSPASTNNDQPPFPQAFSEHELIGNAAATSQTSQTGSAPLLARTDEDLTPKDDNDVMGEIPPPILGTGSDLGSSGLNSSAGSRNVIEITDWIQSVSDSSTSQAANNTSGAAQPRTQFESAPRNYDIMSPIPEASQELTSSMSQPSTHLNRLSGSQFRSVSPISEHTSSSDVQRSVSPNPQLVCSGSEQPSTQQSGTSEQDSTGHGSSVLTALNVGSNKPAQTGQTGSETGQTGLKTRETGEASSGFVSGNTTASPIERGSPTREEDQSHADHVTSSYESQASSARAEVGGTNEAQSSTPMPSRSSDATPTLERDYATPTPGREHTHSSNESIERGRQVSRGKSPQSLTSATASLAHSGLRPACASESSGRRPLSPLATTVRKSIETLDTVGRTESRQEAEFQPNETVNGDRNEPQASGMEQRPGSALESASGSRKGPASRFRYSQQRVTDYPRHQPKLSQDLEMMNLAISGMDNTTSSALSRSVRSEPPPIRESRSPTGHAQRPGSNLPLRASRSTGHAQRQGSGSSHGNEQRTGHAQRQIRGLQRMEQPPGNEQRTGHTQRQTRSRNDADPSRIFRPITPVLQGSSRPASTPLSREQDSLSSLLISAQPLTTRAPPPPQVPADSYDYLPPYSPPRPSEEESTHQRHASEPGLLAEPPPSYDEIFGGRDRNENRRRRKNERSRFSRRSNSHRETVDDPSAVVETQSSQASSRPSSRQSNSRRLVSFTNLFKRARRNSNSESTTPVPAPESNPTTQTENADVSTSGQQDLNDYTADWVASYSRTPRPHSVNRHENLAMRSAGSVTGYSVTGHSQVSRTTSDTSSVRSPSTPQTRSQNPVPYRHPPPFPSNENIAQSTTASSVSRSYPPPRHGGSSQSLNNPGSPSTRLPVRTRNHTTGGNLSGHMIPQIRAHARPRPLSAYVPTEMETGNARSGSGVGSASSTPNTRSRRLVGSGGFSSSCFDILSPQSAPNPPSRSTAHDTHTPTPSTAQASTAHTAHTPTTSASQSQTRAPRLTRTESGSRNLSRGQGSTPSLNQRASNLSINANTNNINASASPRASVTSSPISQTSPNRVDSPIAFNLNFSAPFTSQNSASNLIGSNSQDFVENTLTPVASSPSTLVNASAGCSGVGGGGGGVRGSSGDVREGSGRNAMRTRAENRRMLVQGEVSSGEEQHSSQMSNLSQSSQRSKAKRKRRRRSMGSNSTIDVQRSNSQLSTRSNNVSRVSMSGEQSHDQDVQSPDRSHDQRSTSRENIDRVGPRMSRVTEERETQSIEVTIEGVADDTSPSSLTSKSCGHPCDSGDQVMCCLCTVEQRAAAFPGSQGNELNVINSCHLCQRRERNTNSPNSGLYSNKDTQRQTRVQTNEGTARNRPAGKNCSIM